MAVKDLNIEIPDGEFLVFVGPSGCGKSTSLRMLAGLEEITEGEILIGDRVVNNVAPKDRDIAMVFQSYALYPHMTVYDNMAFGLRLRRTPKQVIDERVREVAASLGIEQLLDRRPRQLSGGQRQRVAVGRAIVREPAVFLLDEPLSNLDAKLRVEARTFISKLHQRLGTTFIYVTHDQVEAMTMGQRICVLNAGSLMQIDTPTNLYDHPSNVFVAGFIGSPSMNFFDNAILKEENGKMVVDTGMFLVECARRTLRPVPSVRWQEGHLRHPSREYFACRLCPAGDHSLSYRSERGRGRRDGTRENPVSRRRRQDVPGPYRPARRCACWAAHPCYRQHGGDAPVRRRNRTGTSVGRTVVRLNRLNF